MAKISGLVDKLGAADKAAVGAMAKIEQLPVKGAEQPVAPVAPVAHVEKKTTTLASAHDQVQEIPLDKVVRSPFQVRTMGDEDYIRQLMESIQASGVISPIVVRLTPAGTDFELVAGEHRAEASRRLGHMTIKAIVRTMSDAEAAKALAAENAVRKSLDDFDKFKHARMLKDNGFCRSDREVAATLGVTKSQVSALNAFGQLPDEAQALLAENPGLLGATAAKQIAEFAAEHPKEVMRAIKRIASGSLLQSKASRWIASEAAVGTESYREVIEVKRPNAPGVRVVVTDSDARIQLCGINAQKLRALIEANLHDLVTPS